MLPEYYNVLTNEDAVEIFYDANELFGQKKYAICVYQAFVAKQVFAKHGNKTGILFSEYLIDDAIRKLRSKVIKRTNPPTPFNVDRAIICSEEVKELGECFKDELKQGRLEEVVSVYKKLVEGESFDPFKKSLFPNN